MCRFMINRVSGQFQKREKDGLFFETGKYKMGVGVEWIRKGITRQLLKISSWGKQSKTLEIAFDGVNLKRTL